MYKFPSNLDLCICPYKAEIKIWCLKENISISKISKSFYAIGIIFKEIPRICLEDSGTVPCQALSGINGVVICTAFFDANPVVMIPTARTGTSSVLMQEFLERETDTKI